jgi:hypothetical protein
VLEVQKRDAVQRADHKQPNRDAESAERDERDGDHAHDRERQPGRAVTDLPADHERDQARAAEDEEIGATVA